MDDVAPAGACHAVVVRSPHAHAEIGAVDTAAAEAMPGVLAVLTAADAAADGLSPIPPNVPPSDSRGQGVVVPCPLLAADRVRFVGQGVALVIAETLAAAEDAAEAVAVDYEVLPAVASVEDAVRPGAPAVHEAAPDNLSFRARAGDDRRVAEAMQRAAHVAQVRLVNNRVVAAYMESRGAVGEYDPGSERYTLYTNTQTPHLTRRQIAGDVLGIAGHGLRVIVPDIGGAFGAKAPVYPEQALVLWAARRLGRPVKWVAGRTESFLADTHARDNVSTAQLALDADGRFLALRVRTLANLGACLATHGAYVPASSMALFTSVYRLPALSVEVDGVFTNTVPTDAYRGAGRPEVIYIVERLIDLAARQTGTDPVALRERNMISPDDIPFRTPMGWTIDAGDFPGNLRQALRLADRAGFPARREAARGEGRLRGLGIANHMDRAAGGPLEEFGEVRFDPTGSVAVFTGTMASGQGHETVLAGLTADALGVAPESVRVVQGDTDQVAMGTGTFGSRSLVVGGSAIVRAAERVVEKARQIAAHRLEADPEDVAFEGGTFRIAGTDRTVGIVEVARLAFSAATVPPGMETGLGATATFRPVNHTFSNGCHVAEVEVDPATGAVVVTGYVAVDDYGRLVSREAVIGQVVGGVAQGLGQALSETIRHDGDGQLLTASFLDYALPRADDTPVVEAAFTGEPLATNAIGAKGCGESGTIAAPPAVMNAVIDALAEAGVTHIDMPATPERVWRALRQAGAA